MTTVIADVLLPPAPSPELCPAPSPRGTSKIPLKSHRRLEIPGESRGNPAPPGTSYEELVTVPAARSDPQVALIFPFLWDLSLISTQGFSCTSRLARSPSNPLKAAPEGRNPSGTAQVSRSRPL